MPLAHPIFPITIGRGIGKVLLTPCPGTQEASLGDSLGQLAAAGAMAVITLMPLEEMQRNAVTDLPELSAQLGLQWLYFPIEENHAPEKAFHQAWQTDKSTVHQLLTSGKSIAIHCKNGTSRAGLVAALILLEQGLPWKQVMQRVRAARPNALQLPAHQSYIRLFEKN
ncbi:MAG: tyrosine-protein phosphatase [Pseudomonadota bacterium]